MWDQATEAQALEDGKGPKELACVAYAQWFVEKAPTVIPAQIR